MEFNEHFMARVLSVNNTLTGRIYFEALTTFRPSVKDIKQAQEKLGFHPLGYGCPMFSSTTQLKNGKYETHWECMNSCE